MKRLASALLATAILAVPAQQAAAQTNFSHIAQFSPGSTVLYLPFNVLVTGTFTIETFGGGVCCTGSLIDPYLILFAGASSDGPGLGALMAEDDDGGTNLNSLMIQALGVGDYTLAMSVWSFGDAEARAGANTFAANTSVCDDDGIWTDCVYQVDVTSAEGVATALNSTVPEPVTLLLLGTGLLGIVAVRRRRSVEEEDEA